MQDQQKRAKDRPNRLTNLPNGWFGQVPKLGTMYPNVANSQRNLFIASVSYLIALLKNGEKPNINLYKTY